MKDKPPSFQEKLQLLEQIQEDIQDNANNDLEELITLYEKGLSLSTDLEKEIEKYEARILSITEASQQTSEDSFGAQLTKKDEIPEDQKSALSTTRKNTKKERNNSLDLLLSRDK